MQLRRAEAEAQKRWGDVGRVRRERCRMIREGKLAGRCTASVTGAHPRDCTGGRTACAVGRLNGVAGLGFFVIEGTGPTFEAAFARYDLGRLRDRARYCRATKTHNRLRRCRICKYRGPAKAEGLAELQPDETLLTTDERLAAWRKAQDEAAARREADRAESARARELKAAAEKLAQEEDLRIPEHAAAELARRGGPTT
jgi:hypothetical protein